MIAATTEPYWILPAAWLAIAFVVLWAGDPAHKRTRKALRTLCRPLLPLYGLAIRLRIIR